jgi:hypothetical protein
MALVVSTVCRIRPTRPVTDHGRPNCNARAQTTTPLPACHSAVFSASYDVAAALAVVAFLVGTIKNMLAQADCTSFSGNLWVASRMLWLPWHLASQYGVHALFTGQIFAGLVAMAAWLQPAFYVNGGRSMVWAVARCVLPILSPAVMDVEPLEQNSVLVALSRTIHSLPLTIGFQFVHATAFKVTHPFNSEVCPCLPLPATITFCPVS